MPILQKWKMGKEKTRNHIQYKKRACNSYKKNSLIQKIQGVARMTLPDGKTTFFVFMIAFLLALLFIEWKKLI